MPKTKEEVRVTIEKGNLYEINPKGKYLLILPKDANIQLISSAISEFFKPAQVFVLAANDLTEIKIAELVTGN